MGLHTLRDLPVDLVVLSLAKLLLVGLDTQLLHDDVLGLGSGGGLGDHEGESVNPHLLQQLLVLHLHQDQCNKR